jgi:hypothetical protein
LSRTQVISYTRVQWMRRRKTWRANTRPYNPLSRVLQSSSWKLNLVLDMVSKVWYRIPFYQSEVFISQIKSINSPKIRCDRCPWGLDFEEIRCSTRDASYTEPKLRIGYDFEVDLKRERAPPMHQSNCAEHAQYPRIQSGAL